MCGIAGIYKYGKEPIKEEYIASLLVGNEHRGNDATGMAFLQEDGSLDVLKKDIPAWEFVSSNEYKDCIIKKLTPKTRAVILHARGASQGTPRKYENNHPMFQGKTAVVHNGSIKNDYALFNGLHLKREAETDSDILRAIFDAFGFTDKGYQNLAKVSGSAAGAALCLNSDKMIIFRSGSPMTIASTDNFLAFSSLKNTLHSAFKPVVNRFNIPFQIQRTDLAFSLMPNHTLWILGPKGLEGHREFKTLEGRYVEPIRRVYKEYKKRSERWDKQTESDKRMQTARVQASTNEELGLAWCPKCQKEWAIPSGEIPRNYTCNAKKGGCGLPLTVLPGPTVKTIN